MPRFGAGYSALSWLARNAATEWTHDKSRDAPWMLSATRTSRRRRETLNSSPSTPAIGRGAVRGPADGQGGPDARGRRKPEQVFPRRRGDCPRRGMADGDVRFDRWAMRWSARRPLPVGHAFHATGRAGPASWSWRPRPCRTRRRDAEFVLDLWLGLQETFDVLIVAPRWPPGSRKEEIDGLRIERFAYFRRRWESFAEGATPPNLKTRPSTALQVPFPLGSFLWSSFRAGRRFRPDVIHAHWPVPGGSVALLVSRLLSVPYVVTAHAGTRPPCAPAAFKG